MTETMATQALARSTIELVPVMRLRGLATRTIYWPLRSCPHFNPEWLKSIMHPRNDTNTIYNSFDDITLRMEVLEESQREIMSSNKLQRRHTTAHLASQKFFDPRITDSDND